MSLQWLQAQSRDENSPSAGLSLKKSGLSPNLGCCQGIKELKLSYQNGIYSNI